MQKQLILAVVFGCGLSSTSLVFAGEIHSWEEITYPNLKSNFRGGFASPSIGIAGKEGLHFNLSFSWLFLDKTNEALPEPGSDKIRVRLHYPDGSIVKPVEPKWGINPFTTISHGYAFVSIGYVFPWGKNEMQEGWLEIVFPERSYWLEIPYGFTRDPKLTSFPTAKTGSPKLPVALENAPKNTKIINWKYVSYDLGEIQNGWRLSLYHSNPFDAHSEIVLYREDSKVGKSMFLWDLFSPRTKISIRPSDKSTLRGHAMSLRLHQDGLRRSDKFDFPRNPYDDELRDWGTMIIEIDDKKWTTIMPSSLFKCVHGVADPYNKSKLR